LKSSSQDLKKKIDQTKTKDEVAQLLADVRLHVANKS